MALATTSALFPVVSVTPLWALAGAGGERSTLSTAFLGRRRANTFSAVLDVAVAAVEIAWILGGANRSGVIRVVAVASPLPDL